MVIREKVGDYFMDLSKLIFGGVVLSAIINLNADNLINILVYGILSTLFFGLIGYIVYKYL